MRFPLYFTLLNLLLAIRPGAAQDVALEGIAHVAFRVADVPASRDFYRTLGFEQAFEFGSGPTLVSYIKVNDRQFIELYNRATSDQPLGLMHLCFEMADTERLFDAYVKRGLTPTDKRKARAGNLLFNLRDDDGQVVEYTQYLPGSLHSNDRGQHLGTGRISTLLAGATASAKALPAGRAFFVDKLGFVAGAGSASPLRLPGGSGHEIRLEALAPGWKPRIDLAVPDLARAVAALRARGLTVRTSPAAALVTDPDGATVAFIAR